MKIKDSASQVIAYLQCNNKTRLNLWKKILDVFAVYIISLGKIPLVAVYIRSLGKIPLKST